MAFVPKIALCPGEPGGIGPDLAIMLAQMPLNCELVVYGCPELLMARAQRLKLPLKCLPHTPGCGQTRPKSHIAVQDIPMEAPCEPGTLDPVHAPYVLTALTQAYWDCEQGICQALVTGPVQKSTLCHGNFEFLGHTQFLADLAQVPRVLMTFVSESLIMGLITTHIPLSEVPRHLTPEDMEAKLRLLDHFLREKRQLQSPIIGLMGLNPHAGEDGHIGCEDQEILSPLIERLNTQGLTIIGPIPPDSAFLPHTLKEIDGLMALYHDQGLTAFKALYGTQAVNLSLGLPIIRTSVDHGTALSLAGTTRANPESLWHAVHLAQNLCTVE